MFIFHPSDESTSAAGGLPCLWLAFSCLPVSARQLNVLSESLITGVNVSTLVVTFPSKLVCNGDKTENKNSKYMYT